MISSETKEAEKPESDNKLSGIVEQPASSENIKNEKQENEIQVSDVEIKTADAENDMNTKENEQIQPNDCETKELSIEKEHETSIMSSPDNHKENESDIKSNECTLESKHEPKIFESYITLLNNQQKQKEVWNKTMKERLENASNCEDYYNKIRNSPKLQLSNETSKPQVAPFPTLPSSQEILAHLKATEDEIILQKRKLQELIISIQPKVTEFGSTEDAPPEIGIRNCSGVIIGKKAIDSIILANRAKASKSHDRSILHNEITSKYKRIGDYPHYFMDNTQFIEPMLEHIAESKEEEFEYNQKLTREYIERKEIWDEMSDNLNTYHKVLHASIDVWPPEFAANLPKETDHEKLLSVVAPDQIMYNSQEEKEAYLYYDENMLVEDPERAHQQFKNRLKWTDHEKKIFMEKYALHPREFKKIANSLPGKSIKDVIEYYHIYRIKLDLKKLEVAARTKGSKRRVIAEGSRK